MAGVLRVPPTRPARSPGPPTPPARRFQGSRARTRVPRRACCGWGLLPWHPWVWGVLSPPEARPLYDTCGREWLSDPPPPPLPSDRCLGSESQGLEEVPGPARTPAPFLGREAGRLHLCDPLAWLLCLGLGTAEHRIPEAPGRRSSQRCPRSEHEVLPCPWHSERARRCSPTRRGLDGWRRPQAGRPDLSGSASSSRRWMTREAAPETVWGSTKLIHAQHWSWEE